MRYKEGSLYLAHPLKMRHEVREWELDFERQTDQQLLNPFYDVDGREDIKQMDQGIIKPRTMKNKMEGLDIIFKDLNLIDLCVGSDRDWETS